MDRVFNKIFSKSALESYFAIEEKVNEINQLKHESSEQAKLIEQSYKEKISQLEAQNQNLTTSTSKNISDSVKNTCVTFIQKINKELIGYEYLIDKRIITDLLIKIFDKSCDAKIKKSLMETMASFMELSNEDRTKMGITHSNIKQQQTGNIPVIDLLKEFDDYLSKI